MNYRKVLFIICCAGFFGWSSAQAQDIRRVRAFLEDAVNDRIDNESIIRNHICIDKENVSPSEQEGYMKYLREMLDGFRQGLPGKGSATSLSIRKYLEILRDEQTLQHISDEAKANVYVYQYKNTDRKPGFILVKEGRIASFLRMTKGEGMRYFLLTCSSNEY